MSNELCLTPKGFVMMVCNKKLGYVAQVKAHRIWNRVLSFFGFGLNPSEIQRKIENLTGCVKSFLVTFGHEEMHQCSDTEACRIKEFLNKRMAHE